MKILRGDLTELARIGMVALIALGVWTLARYATFQPPVLGLDAPQTQFSAVRAERVLARILDRELPHPAGSEENRAVRERILGEYAALGIPAKTYRALGCRMNRNFGALSCATTTDIVAQVRPGNGKAIIMLSHYDSVPAGPGASDDESGTAAVIESARALKTSANDGVHPVLAVNTDGEEFGLLGAAAFLDDRQLKSLVGAVVNVEARGDQGPSLLFQTSDGDGPLIALYAKSVRAYATSSLFEVIYKLLPNDTDLTLFIQKGFPSWNFAFSNRVAHYHTPLDLRRNLDPQSLQMQGENLLGVTRSLTHTDFESLKGGNDVYISVLGRWLPRIQAGWALPLSLIALIALIAAAIAGNGASVPRGRWFIAFAVFPGLIVFAATFGWILHAIASLVSGEPDPSYAHPALLRAALALGVLGAAIFVARWAEVRLTALAVWIWMAVLAVTSAVFLTGLSPYFLFPLIVSTPILIGLSFWSDRWDGEREQLALLVAAFISLLLWLSLVASAELVGGLALHPLFTVPASVGLACVTPLLAGGRLPARVWKFLCGAVAVAAVAFAAAAGLQPAYSAVAPQRLNIDYIEDATTNRAVWSADANAPLPGSLRAAANFSKTPERPYAFAYRNTYIASAGAPLFSPPAAIITPTGRTGGPRHVLLALNGSQHSDQMIVALPKGIGLKAIEMEGKHFDVPAEWASSPLPYNVIACFGDDCGGKLIGLDFVDSRAVNLLIAEVRYGLPPAGGRLQAARPKTAIPSQNGDTTILVTGGRIQRP